MKVHKSSAAAVHDDSGSFIAGKVKPVNIAPEPQVSIQGLDEGLKGKSEINSAVSLSSSINFPAAYVKYTAVNDDGREIFSEKADPKGSFTWSPQAKDNGKVTIRAAACDASGSCYESSPVEVNVNVDKNVELRGVSEGSDIKIPVTLWLSRNFEVDNTKYMLKNTRTGEEKSLFKADGYSSYEWFPEPESSGEWEVFAKVEDSSGETHSTKPVKINVPSEPLVLLKDIGPDQVLANTVQLTAAANIPLDIIEFRLINPETGAEKVIAKGENEDQEYSWTPAENDSGNRQIQAVGTMPSGRQVTSSAVPVEIYTGELYQPKPIVEKDRFLDFAAELAQESYKETEMSAALQTAQAILETGWGQSIPVDKYTGKMSYNLFGIKGEGPAGTVTHNTWEEYNGNIFEVDAQFRAYNSVSESWKDHKQHLLTSSRYAPFREVMHNSVQGAWALKRAGYATDSQYPLKLIDIINRYNLHTLDKVKL